MPKYSKPNDWGGNSISHALFHYLEINLPAGKTILELGSGWATGKLVEMWNVWSVENQPEWFQLYNDQSFLVPLKDKWYDVDILKKCLDGLEYDLLLIDGPYNDREGLVANFDLFKHDVPIVFDDVMRASGLKIMRDISEILDRPYIEHSSGSSMFGVIE